jgi:carboxypeptidase family protein
MRRALVVIVVALMCTVWPVTGQSTFGGIVGVVHDASQGSIAGASVQIRSLEDNSIHSTTAGADGSFEFVNLKPGEYALSAQATGFAEFQVPSAELNTRQKLRIDVAMAVETQVQKVEVSETVAVINTENGIIGDSKGTSEISQLPMNFRAVSTSPLGALQSSANVQQDSQGNIALGASDISWPIFHGKLHLGA